MVHVPVVHEAAAFGNEQAVPHDPQSVSVRVLVSQPLFGLPSQSANPALHTGVHAPATQVVVPLPLEQAVPHSPQFVTVVSATSQPLPGLPSQLPHPALHVNEHAPLMHSGVALFALQAWPHWPQLATLVARFDSHPLLRLASQLPYPVAHARPHTPALQAGLLFGLDVQMTPHAPQFRMLFCVMVSQPFAALLSQLPYPVTQEEIAQVPVAHVVLALDSAHATPQAPQSVFVSRLASQPFAGSPSQLPVPVAQLAQPHTPATQLAEPLGHEQT
jgi:hypothetical protein